MKYTIDFATLFFECTNEELMKDVAQVPYVLHRDLGIRSALVTSYVKADGNNIENVKGLDLQHFPMLVNGKITGFIYLFLYARKIKWLNIYHIDKKSYYWAKWFKFLNPQGHVYLKMDAGYKTCDEFDINLSRRAVFQNCAKIVDIISVESESVRKRIQKYTEKKIYLIPNGYCTNGNLYLENLVRENIFLTVGRLGNESKATDVLLQAFAKCAEKTDWNLRLVGKIEAEFLKYIEEYFEKYPMLKSRVEFAGEITKREILNKEYQKAKIFVLPSRWESFGLVLVEALSNGCRLLSTKEVPPIDEITDGGKYGRIVSADNVDELANAMLEMTKEEYSEYISEDMREYAYSHFEWGHICKEIYKLMFMVEQK